MPTGDEEIADLSQALNAALRHASAMVDAEHFGADLRRIVEKARLLHGILETRLATEENWMADEVSIIIGDTENILERLEALAGKSPPEI